MGDPLAPPARPTDARLASAVHSGAYYKPIVNSAGSLALAAGALHVIAIDLPAGVILNRIGAEILGAGTAGSKLRLGIYADSTGIPGALLLDAGTVDGTSATRQEIAISQTISRNGRYWLAALSEVAAPTVRTWAVPGQTGLTLAEIFGGNLFGMAGYANTGSSIAAGSLPSPFPTFAFNSSAAAVCVKVA